MEIVFREFLGDASKFYKQTRQEFFEMRCCSLDKRDIDYHYMRMSFRYHALGGINDETLRQVYLNSLPTKLQGELQRLIGFSGRGIRDITLGEIHMFTHTALDKLCATQRVFAKMIREGPTEDGLPGTSPERKGISQTPRGIGNINIKGRRPGDPGTNSTSALPVDKRVTRPSNALIKEQNQLNLSNNLERLLMKSPSMQTLNLSSQNKKMLTS
ncbi:hypothetical protein Ddye_024766 [Dipteronia dyeriana]|uniref:Uncharacterized protein n=1 Tax=Dipteronia dyeriana TaxID=168575 RepID=A0AAD9TW31_9ROSI|nr:hypothetical protein Ddye_024766 [Dipteronia dyeriana]